MFKPNLGKEFSLYTFIMFTTGRLIFVVFFLIVFIAGLIFAYRKDIAKSPWYFKGSYKIIFSLIGIYLLYFITVRFIL